jgi:hypothetical protein
MPLESYPSPISPIDSFDQAKIQTETLPHCLKRCHSRARNTQLYDERFDVGQVSWPAKIQTESRRGFLAVSPPTPPNLFIVLVALCVKKAYFSGRYSSRGPNL